MKKLGFTLIDLIVSLSIFVVITGVVVVNFRAGQINDSVRQSANITASFLRKAQIMTLTGAKAPDSTFPAGGWGVRFDSDDTNTVVLFADSDGDYVYDDGEEVDTEDFSPGAYFVVDSTLDIVFSSPDADVYFNGNQSSISENISIAAQDADIMQRVIIYRLSGQIRVE